MLLDKQEALMIIHTSKGKNVVIVTVKGRMDAATAPEFDAKMGELLAQEEKYFLLNFGELEYISSAGLRSILTIRKRLETNNGKILISNLTGPVKEVFEISGFCSIFQTYETEEDALEQF
jgi:anti-anti-sigma factor